MKILQLVCGISLIGTASWAEGNYPKPGTSFLYDEYFLVGSEPFEENLTIIESEDQAQLLYKIEQVAGDQIAYASCEPSGTDCWHYIHRDLFFGQNKVFQDVPDPTLDRFTGLSDFDQFVEVETQSETGGAFFPLQNGKALAWSESWTAKEWSADYRMTVKQTCCFREGFGVAASGELWRFDYTFEQVGRPEASGTATYFYDTNLKWFTGIETRQTETANRHTVVRSVLRSVDTR